ncbi:hydantoinase/oxoprolinase family protein [Coralliovum pocilloporae]|uniref:hydantoinase/oxoprolinase family protein n=1 Tax=Coralliovum pocilloporae TaxID=3066369 RepID=UPI003306BC23
MLTSQQLRLAIDIGGTFTDTVLVDSNQQVLASTKNPTTPADPTEGALTGIHHVLGVSGYSPADIGLFIHGTTLATNALIERCGSKVSTITTHGFRDILEIAYERRYSQYDINISKPDLIVPRSRSFTIGGRVDFMGKELAPLDDNGIENLVVELEAAGTEAVAICLLHSYANPDHERRLAEELRIRLPDIAISRSSKVSPEAREFDRLCTTIANAYVQPMMSAYLSDFEQRIHALGITCPILMMTASGGMTTLKTAAAYPIRLVESGPAGGAILAAQVARDISADKVLSFDMGGTTAKLCLIDNYEPQSTRHFEISRAERFVKGSGMPVRIPVLDMIEIGAGGGSIASVDRLGRLQVGPKSAGSEPGPAAFDRGGTHPTVTDADLVLGYLDPASFADGHITLDETRSRNAIDNEVGHKLATDEIRTAAGISEIVDDSMASAARMHAVETGKDLGERVMIAFGGNGPLHATRVAKRAGVSRILVPPEPGVGSAVGFLFAPISYEIVRSRYTLLESFTAADVNTLLADMEADARTVVTEAAQNQPLIRKRIAFMRYHGQGHELEIPLPDRPLENRDSETLKTAFEEEYCRQFTRAVPDMAIEILNWGLKLSTFHEYAAETAKDHSVTEVKPPATRRILCDVTGEDVHASIYKRKDLTAGTVICGPALIQETQTTTLVSADFAASVDSLGNLVLSRKDTS